MTWTQTGVLTPPHDPPAQDDCKAHGPCPVANTDTKLLIHGLFQKGRVLAQDGIRCLRCLLLVMCTYPFAKKELTLHLARGKGRERYFGCNLMQRKVLASSHQHLMAEAPAEAPLDGGSTRQGA